MKLTEKLSILFETAIPNGQFKFVSWTGDGEGADSAIGAIGDFRKGPQNGLDFLGDKDNVYIRSKTVKQSGNKLVITDGNGAAYNFEVA